MAMDYPNPIHWDEGFARDTKFGGLVAPQSMCVKPGLRPWLSSGVRRKDPGLAPDLRRRGMVVLRRTPIRPGDQLFQERRFHDYKVTDTKFAGPTMFSARRYHPPQPARRLVAKAARDRDPLSRGGGARSAACTRISSAPIRRWTQAELEQIEKVRHEWLLSNRARRSPHFEEVKVGDKLPRRVIGPHSIASFTTEYRAFIFNIWGTLRWVPPPGVKDPWINQDPGWTRASASTRRAPRSIRASATACTSARRAATSTRRRRSEIGMGRAYGYGATMGAWCTDYLAYWAGHDGMVRHTKTEFRGPAFEGDVTYFDGEVVEKGA